MLKEMEIYFSQCEAFGLDLLGPFFIGFVASFPRAMLYGLVGWEKYFEKFIAVREAGVSRHHGGTHCGPPFKLLKHHLTMVC